MSYKFRDTTAGSASNSLPAEALSIDGEYIENVISGYQTLNVSGREVFLQEATDLEVGKHHGSFLTKRRFPSRELVVTYQLIAESNAAFRDAFNALNGLLDTKDARLIFADEPDKFFIGTPTGFTQVEAGRNAVTGQITFTCYDPFKYSVAKYEVAASPTDHGAMIIVNYNGTEPSYPELEVDFYKSSSQDNCDGDCGCVAEEPCA